jgi:hypothetical protein
MPHYSLVNNHPADGQRRPRVLIRAWTEADQRSAADLVATLVGRDSSAATQVAVHGPDQYQPLSFRRTLVAVDQGAIVGLGTLWENWLHPARWRVTLHGRPTFWSRSPASAMLAQLRALRPDGRPLQTAFSVVEEAGGEFFQQHGFAPLMRTRRGVLAPDAMTRRVAAELDVAMARIKAAGYRVASLAELGSAWEPVNTLAWLHAEVYRLGHRWDLVRPLAAAEAVELFLDPGELLPEAMYLALIGEHPVAVASLRRSGAPSQVDLGWVGALPAVATRDGDLVFALVGRCLRHAALVAWHVLLEVDEADTHLWQLLDQLPVALDPDWLTFAELPRAERTR